MDEALLKAFFTLGMVVVLLAGVLYFVKRYSATRLAKGTGSQFRVLSTLALAPKKSMYLVQVADKIIIVGSGENGLTLLSEINDPDTIAQLLEGQGRKRPGLSNGLSARKANGSAQPASAAGSELDETLSFAEFLKSLGRK